MSRDPRDAQEARDALNTALTYLVDDDGYQRADLEGYVADLIADLYAEEGDTDA